MQLILMERIEGLGNVGDEVHVRAGYSRNFLLPQGKAIKATQGNRQMFERRRTILEARQHSETEKAQAIADKLGNMNLSITRAASDGERLYGAITTTDLAELLKEAGQAVERRHILVDTQIKSVGRHPFRVRLHPDVTASLSVKVEAESA